MPLWYAPRPSLRQASQPRVLRTGTSAESERADYEPGRAQAGDGETRK